MQLVGCKQSCCNITPMVDDCILSGNVICCKLEFVTKMIQFKIHALGCENTRTSSAKNNHHLTRVIKNWFCGVHGVVMQPNLPKGRIGCPLGVCYEADGDLNDSQSGPSLLFCIWVGWTELVWCGSSWFRPSNVRLSDDVTTKIKWSKHTTVITG